MRLAPLLCLPPLLLLSACKDRPAAAPERNAPAAAAVPAHIASAPGVKENARAEPLEETPRPVSAAAPKLPRNPFTLLRTQEQLVQHWKLAGASGTAPSVDFERFAVVALRLPGEAKAAEMAPRVFSIMKGTHIVLKNGTPRELGGAPTDRIHYYRVPTLTGPIASIAYEGTP